MSEIASAFVSLVPSAKGFGSKTQRQIGPQMDSVAKKSGSRFGKVFAYSSMSPLKAIGAAAFGLFAIRKVKDFFGSAITEARESQKVSAITAQVIKTTGGAAQISAKQVGMLAAAISNKTGIDDEAIQSASNLLLTFKNLRNEAGKGNDVFSQTTKIAVDMGAALGKEPKAAAIQLGKALNDPIKGITALTRAGVSFTEAQKKQIGSMVESGNTLGAQKLILKELNSEFGGTAAAAATAGDKFTTTFANFKESIGTAMLPSIDKALNAGTKLLLFLGDRLPPIFANLKTTLAPVAAFIGTAFAKIGDLIRNNLTPFFTILSGAGGAAVASFVALIGGTLLSALGALAAAFASPVVIIGALVGAAIYAYTHFEGFRATVDGLVGSLKTNFLPVLQQAATTFTTVILPAVTALATYLASKLGPIFTQIAGVITGTVLPILASLAAFIYGDLYPAIAQIVSTVGQKLKPVFDQLAATFQAKVLPTLQQLLAKFREWQPTIQIVVLAIVKVAGKILEFVAVILSKVLPVLIRFSGVFISTVVPAVIKVIEYIVRAQQRVATFAGGVIDAIAAAVRFAKGIKDKFGEALDFIQGIPGKVKSAFSNAATLLVSAGEDTIRGFISGLRSMAGAVIAAIKSTITDALPGYVKKALGIASPSKVFAELGMWSMKGLAKGVADNADAPANAVAAALEKVRDKVKSAIDGLKSDFASLADTVSGAFTGNMFEAATGAGFFTQGVATMTNLMGLRAAFKKLRKWGIDPKFLSAMFSSGNSALILDLASGPRWQAVNNAGLFDTNTQLATQLGSQVALADIGPELRKQTHRLERIEAAIDRLPKGLGREINGAATAGHRGRSAA